VEKEFESFITESTTHHESSGTTTSTKRTEIDKNTVADHGDNSCTENSTLHFNIFSFYYSNILLAQIFSQVISPLTHTFLTIYFLV